MSRIAPPIRVSQALCGLIDWAGKFGVDQQRQAGSSHVRQRGAKLGFGDHGEPIDSGMNQKALEPHNPRCHQPLNVGPFHPTLAVAAYTASVALASDDDPLRIRERARTGLRQKPDARAAEAYRLSLDGWRALERCDSVTKYCSKRRPLTLKSPPPGRR